MGILKAFCRSGHFRRHFRHANDTHQNSELRKIKNYDILHSSKCHSTKCGGDIERSAVEQEPLAAEKWHFGKTAFFLVDKSQIKKRKKERKRKD